MRLRYTKKALQRANRQVYGLVKRTILTKKRKSDGKILNVISGDLSTKIKPFFIVKKGELLINIDVMKYYQYLDKGTDRIKPWFLSEEIMESEYMKRIIEDLTSEALNQATIDILSKYKSK